MECSKAVGSDHHFVHPFVLRSLRALRSESPDLYIFSQTVSHTWLPSVGYKLALYVSILDSSIIRKVTLGSTTLPRSTTTVSCVNISLELCSTSAGSSLDSSFICTGNFAIFRDGILEPLPTSLPSLFSLLDAVMSEPVLLEQDDVEVLKKAAEEVYYPKIVDTGDEM